LPQSSRQKAGKEIFQCRIYDALTKDSYAGLILVAVERGLLKKRLSSPGSVLSKFFGPPIAAEFPGPSLVRKEERYMTKRVAVVGAIVLMAFAVLAPLASADNIVQGKQIDFTGGKGGAMSFQLGMGNTLSVNNAPIGNLIQFPSFLNFPVVGGFLNLTTGACESGCTKFNNGSGTSTLFFDDGGALTIFGEIPSIGINTVTPLITGIFNSNGMETHETNSFLNSKNGHGGINGYLNITMIDPTIVQALNLLGGNGHGFLSEMFVTLSFDRHHQTWNGNVDSTDLIIKPAPEPTSLLLLGSGLIVAAALVRRRIESGA
jgi:hypothetical protein